MIQYLTIGIFLGLSAGLAPGPLLTLVIAESLQHGIRAGVKVACAPIFTDLPIILFTLLVISQLAGVQYGLGLISLAGGLFILYSGYGSIRTKAIAVTVQPDAPRSLLKGVTANILNPHPYLFWISVGVPTMTKALSMGMAVLVAFICGFYLALVGSKVFLAMAVGKSRSFLSGKVYLYTLRLLGILLCGFAFVLFRDGALLMGLL